MQSKSTSVAPFMASFRQGDNNISARNRGSLSMPCLCPLKLELSSCSSTSSAEGCREMGRGTSVRSK